MRWYCIRLINNAAKLSIKSLKHCGIWNNEYSVGQIN